VNAVGEADVTRVARSCLHPDDMITVIVGDPEVVGPAMQSEGFPEPRTVTVE
jgi:hypothetical protein